MKKVLGILIAIVIVGGTIGGFFFIKNIKVVKEVKDINESILTKMLDENEIEYLQKNRFLTDKDIEELNRIKNNALTMNKENQENLEKIQQDENELDNILNNVKESLESSIKNKIIDLNNILAKLNPVSEEEKAKKDEYSKEINSDINEDTISFFIKKYQDLEEYKEKIIVLETEIKNSEQKKQIANIPSYLTREQVVAHGVQMLNFNFKGNDTIGKTYTPEACRVSEKSYADSFANKDQFHRNDSANFKKAINKKIAEYQHKDFYMIYYNDKFNQNTTITNGKTGKTYIVYSSSIANGCSGANSAGGAALSIAYNPESKEIVSVVGTQDIPRFIIDGQAIGFDFNFETGKTNYKI